MKTSMMKLTFSILGWKYISLGKYGPANQDFLFNWEFGT